MFRDTLIAVGVSAALVLLACAALGLTQPLLWLVTVIGG